MNVTARAAASLMISLTVAYSIAAGQAGKGRTPSSPRPAPTPLVDRAAPKSTPAQKPPAANEDKPKYRVIFSTEGHYGTFVDQLNKNAREGYRLKSTFYAYHRFNGQAYNIPVAILQLDETEHEYAWFKLADQPFFASPGFQEEYSGRSKQGFRVVGHFESSQSCGEVQPDAVIPIATCASTFLYLLEREAGTRKPQAFRLASTEPNFKRNMGEKLTPDLQEKLAQGFYPVQFLSNYELLLNQITEKDEVEKVLPEVQVVTSSFRNGVKKKVTKLGQEGFRLALLGEEAAVVYRGADDKSPIVYEWLNARDKKLDEKLAKIQEGGGSYRMLYRDPAGNNELVFERPVGSNQHYEYKTFQLQFEMIEPLPIRGSIEVHIDLTPASKDALKAINNLAKDGYVVRVLFVPGMFYSKVGVLLDRAR